MVSTLAPVITWESVRAEITRLWRENIDQLTTVDLVEQADIIYRQLTSQHVIPAQVALLAKYAIRDLIRNMGLSELTQRRAALRQMFTSQDKNGPIYATAEPSTAQGKLSFSSWFEHVEGRHIQLLKMTRPELKIAIEARRKQVRAHSDAIELMEAIFAKLPDDDTTGEQIMTEQELDRLAATVWR